MTRPSVTELEPSRLESWGVGIPQGYELARSSVRLSVVRDYRRRYHCRQCERHRDDCGHISPWSGLCTTCAKANLAQNVHGLATHSGPAFLRWRRAMAASVGAVIPDEPADVA